MTPVVSATVIPDFQMFLLNDDLAALLSDITTGASALELGIMNPSCYVHYAPLCLDPTFNVGPFFVTELVSVNIFTNPRKLITCGMFIHMKQTEDAYDRMMDEILLGFRCP